MPYRKFWVQALELKYQEEAMTLIPRLLNQYGSMTVLAQEAGITLGHLSRWCDEHGIERRFIYVKRDKDTQPS